MELEFTDDPSAELGPTIREIAGDQSVEGVLVLAAAGDDLTPADVDPALMACPVPVFGGCFPEVVVRGAERETGAVVAGLSVEPRVTAVPGLSDPDRRYAEDLDPAPLEQGHDTAFAFVDAYADRIGDFVTALFTTYGVEFNFLGGGAGSLDEEARPCLFTGDGLVRDAAVFATLDAPSSVGVRHGWEEVDGPFRVTEAEGNRVDALDGESAAAVYRRAIDADDGEFYETAKAHPFGISRLDGEKIVRDPYEVTDDGGLRCFGEVPADEFVHVLRGDPDSLVAAAREAYETATAERDGTVVWFDCISRALFLGDAFERELATVGGDGRPALGALTIGEIANGGEGHLEFYNKTAVAGVIEQI